MSNSKLDLAGCSLVSGDSSATLAGAHVILEPGALYLLARVDEFELNGGITPDDTFSFSLTNTSQTLSLDCDGISIDALTYDSAFPGSAGVAFQLPPEAGDAESNDLTENWCPASTPYGDGDLGSPGAKNPPCLP